MIKLAKLEAWAPLEVVNRLYAAVLLMGTPYKSRHLSAKLKEDGVWRWVEKGGATLHWGLGED